jgi:hypothetical protein
MELVGDTWPPQAREKLAAYIVHVDRVAIVLRTDVSDIGGELLSEPHFFGFADARSTHANLVGIPE